MEISVYIRKIMDIIRQLKLRKEHSLEKFELNDLGEMLFSIYSFDFCFFTMQDVETKFIWYNKISNKK